MKLEPSLYNPMGEVLELFDQPQVLTEKLYYRVETALKKGGVIIESLKDFIDCIHILEEQGLVRVGRHNLIFLKIYRVKNGK